MMRVNQQKKSCSRSVGNATKRLHCEFALKTLCDGNSRSENHTAKTQMEFPRGPAEDVIATELKPNLMGSAGPATYIRIGLENGRFIGHARDRCLHRRCRRGNCACSGLFTLGAKSKELTLFNCADLPREVEVEARADAALIKGLMRRTAEDVITIGQALIRQKAALPHGSFLPWIQAEFSMSERTAQKLMTVVREFAKSAAPADFGMEALYELASADTDIKAEVERRIAAGEIVSAADVKSSRRILRLAGSGHAQMTGSDATLLQLKHLKIMTAGFPWD